MRRLLIMSGLVLAGCASDTWLEPGPTVRAPFPFPGVEILVQLEGEEPILVRDERATADSFALPLPLDPTRGFAVWLRVHQQARLHQPLTVVPGDSLVLPAVNTVRRSGGRLDDPLPLFDWGRPIVPPSIGQGLFFTSDVPCEVRFWSEGSAEYRLVLETPSEGRLYRTVATRQRLSPGEYRFEAHAGARSCSGDVQVRAGAYTVLGLRFGEGG